MQLPKIKNAPSLIMNGRILEEWSSFTETGAYIRMFAHLKWWLSFAGLLVMAIAIERLLWKMVTKIFRLNPRVQLYLDLNWDILT